MAVPIILDRKETWQNMFSKENFLIYLPFLPSGKKRRNRNTGSVEIEGELYYRYNPLMLLLTQSPPLSFPPLRRDPSQ